METVEFLVQGSSLEPYEVVFRRRSNMNLSAYCTCMAGINGSHCKHRINILKGVTKGIVSGEEGIETVISWLPGTDIADALEAVDKIEKEHDQIKIRFAQAKKALAKAMLD